MMNHRKPLKSLAHIVRKPYYKHPFKVCPMPTKYMTEECFIRITSMTQTEKIPKNEIKGVRTQDPYALKMTYHYDYGTYETKGHFLFQPVNCKEKIGSLYYHTLKHIFLHNAFTEDIYEEQSKSTNDYIKPVKYKYTFHIYEGKKPPYNCTTLEAKWQVKVDIQKFTDERQNCPETGHYLGIQGHTIIKKNPNSGILRVLEQDSTINLPTALLADHKQPHKCVPKPEENILVHTTDLRLVTPDIPAIRVNSLLDGSCVYKSLLKNGSHSVLPFSIE